MTASNFGGVILFLRLSPDDATKFAAAVVVLPGLSLKNDITPPGFGAVITD